MNPMQTHVKVLGVLNIVFGALGVLFGLLVFAFFGGVAGIVQMDGDPDAAQVVPILGSLAGLVLIAAIVLSAPAIVTGFGLLHHQAWARILGIVLSVFSLVSFPFGTALGAYGLWVLLNADGARLFEQPSAAPTR